MNPPLNGTIDPTVARGSPALSLCQSTPFHVAPAPRGARVVKPARVIGGDAGDGLGAEGLGVEVGLGVGVSVAVEVGVAAIVRAAVGDGSCVRDTGEGVGVGVGAQPAPRTTTVRRTAAFDRRSWIVARTGPIVSISVVPLAAAVAASARCTTPGRPVAALVTARTTVVGDLTSPDARTTDVLRHGNDRRSPR
jgi:hypothetical protein